MSLVYVRKAGGQLNASVCVRFGAVTAAVNPTKSSAIRRYGRKKTRKENLDEK